MSEDRLHRSRRHAGRRSGRYICALLLLLPGWAVAEPTWLGSWAVAGSTTGPFDAPLAPPSDQTVRQILRLSVGGAAIRLRVSNVHGTAPLRIASARVARHLDGSRIDPATDHPVHFNGRADVTLAPGARVLSDPVRLRVPAFADLAVSLYFAEGATAADSPVTTHVWAVQTNYLVDGEQSAAAELSGASTSTSNWYLTGVDVLRQQPLPVVALLGDSIANGDQSTLGGNRRWSNVIAERLVAPGNQLRVGVVNAGLSGNQITATLIGDGAQARFDRDVLGQSGVTHVILQGGINDLGLPPLLGGAAASAEAIVDGYRQLALRARAQGLTVLATTITPSAGFVLPTYNTAELEARRQAVNAWLRTASEFDAIVDADALLRDPDDPSRLRADITDDFLHPNDAGYEVMTDAVPLRLLKQR